eukprot:6680931-Prymnesium_polylepis.1
MRMMRVGGEEHPHSAARTRTRRRPWKRRRQCGEKAKGQTWKSTSATSCLGGVLKVLEQSFDRILSQRSMSNVCALALVVTA